MRARAASLLAGPAATSSASAASQPGKEDVAMRRGDVRGARAVAMLAVLALGSVLVGSASAAGEVPVRFEARVLWVAGQTLLVATDDSRSVSVDLTYVAQDEYQRLGSDDWVIVTGVLAVGRNRVVATSIERLEP
jgi:hypothetical protein